MEFRKIIEFGKGSYVISLPKMWIEKKRLKKGSSLSYELGANSITFSTDYAEEESPKKEAIINADNKSIDEIETEIITSYLIGDDLIEVHSKNLKVMDERIKKVIMDLAGLEILEQSATKITSKFLLNIREIDLISLIRRMDNITRSLIIDAINCTNGECNYYSIKQRDVDVNRLYYLVSRIVHQGLSSPKYIQLLKTTNWQLYSFLSVAEKLEKTADRQKRIARGLEQLKLSEDYAQELRKVYQSITDSFLDIMKAYYQNDKKEAIKIETTNKSRIDLCNALLTKQFKKRYSLIKKQANLGNYVHEHMIMTDIITNLKSMATSVKMIARLVLNNDLP